MQPRGNFVLALVFETIVDVAHNPLRNGGDIAYGSVEMLRRHVNKYYPALNLNRLDISQPRRDSRKGPAGTNGINLSECLTTITDAVNASSGNDFHADSGAARVDHGEPYS